MTVKIAVDAMGGDHAPACVVEGAVHAVRAYDCEVALVGLEERIREELARCGAAGDVRHDEGLRREGKVGNLGAVTARPRPSHANRPPCVLGTSCSRC